MQLQVNPAFNEFLECGECCNVSGESRTGPNVSIPKPPTFTQSMHIALAFSKVSNMSTDYKIEQRYRGTELSRKRIIFLLMTL